MKKFFSKIKSGVSKALTNIKKVVVNFKDKIKNLINNIKKKNKQEQEIVEISNETTVSRRNINGMPNERQIIMKDSTIPMKSNTKFKTTGYDNMVVPTMTNNNTKNTTIPERKINNIINQYDEKFFKDEEKIENVNNTKDGEKIVSIDIKENIGIVDFETISGKKYQKKIDDILKEKKNIYKNWSINKKCNDFAKNKIQALRLRKKLNPIVISTLNNEEDIDKYIKCIKDTEEIWFNLEHDLINSKLKGKNARLMKRVGKYEEKIGAKVNRKESLIERLLKKIKERNKKPEKRAEEIDDLEKDNTELNIIEEEIAEDIKSRKEERLAKKEAKKLAKKEFKKRYIAYATLIGKLHGLKPKKNLNEIMSDTVDRDIYNLTDRDAWIRAVATFNVGHKISMIKPNEAKIYLISAYNQLNNEELLTNNEDTFQYLEDTLLNLQELYIRDNNFKEAIRLNEEYMSIVEREKKEKFNLIISESKQNNDKIKEINMIINYRKKYVAGQKVKMKILYKAGNKFEAEELYRKILNESGIVLTDEAYDLSIKENCIENGKYIVIKNGRSYREPILGNEKYLSMKIQLQGLTKNKKDSKTILKTEEPKKQSIIETKKETRIKAKEEIEVQSKIEKNEKEIRKQEKSDTDTEIIKTNVEPKEEKITEGNTLKYDTKRKGIIERTKEAIDNMAKEKAKKDKIKKENEEKIIKQREEQRKIEEAKKKKLEEEQKRSEEAKRKLEEQKKAELTEFNKRYNDYDVLVRGITGETSKKDIKAIRNDVVHNDIYNMTSEDNVTKGVATFRVGHRVATLPTKKKEAERLLKSAISILNSDDVLVKNDSLIEILENAHMDLGNLYLMNDDFVNAEKSFVDYMEIVKKEKIERYDPKIINAKNNGKIIDEIDLWMEIKSKFTAGKKSMIKLLSKSGKTEEAEQIYKKLLDECKISLSDEEYQLSVDTNCIENGQYMRITNGRTYREPILGNEYLLLRRKKISEKALSDR